LGLLAALQLLTVIPVKRGFTDRQLRWTTAYFPVVGALIGLVLAGLDYVLGLVLPPSVVSVLLIVSLVVVTGALHLDGLIDTCDGLAAHRSPEERRQVMHDSRTGGFGVVGAVLLLLVKYVLLSNVPEDSIMLTLILMPAVSRWAMVHAIFTHPYANPSGLGKSFKQATGWPQFLLATVITLALAGGLFRLAGLAIVGGVWILVIVVAAYLRRKLAGLTGDTYGAINEIAEAGVLAMVVLLAYNQWLWIT
jgi:adenosylcobinamide-GDP ribazoletransferase